MTEAPAVPDEVLVAQVLDGKIQAFAELTRRHQNRVIRIGLGFFRNEEDAADFAQDVMLKAYTALASFRGAAKFSTWLTRIAYNMAINESAQTPVRSAENRSRGRPGAAPEDRHIRDETVAALRRAMGELPQKYAVCLDMYFYLGMKYGRSVKPRASPSIRSSRTSFARSGNCAGCWTPGRWRNEMRGVRGTLRPDGGGRSLSAALAFHLARCPRCAARVELRRALDLYRLPPAAGGIDLADRVLAALPFLPAPTVRFP
jgi:RNA polymerase sigma-70 factor (ECF subfamily)